MNGCHGHTTRCDGFDIMPVSLGLGKQTLFCRGCRAVAAVMGLQVIERRTTVLPVKQERRRPLWLRRGIPARDTTGLVLAGGVL